MLYIYYIICCRYIILFICHTDCSDRFVPAASDSKVAAACEAQGVGLGVPGLPGAVMCSTFRFKWFKKIQIIDYNIIYIYVNLIYIYIIAYIRLIYCSAMIAAWNCICCHYAVFSDPFGWGCCTRSRVDRVKLDAGSGRLPRRQTLMSKASKAVDQWFSAFPSC